MPKSKWFEIKLSNKDKVKELEDFYLKLKSNRKTFNEKLTAASKKIEAFDDLPPGVLKMVKVF